MKYLLRGLDDLVENYNSYINEVLNPESSKILCMGTGFEDICNYQCIYCYAGDVAKKDRCQLMDFETYDKLFKEANECGCNTIILTGASSQAEPLLSSKVVKAVETLHNYDIVPVIFSNLSVIGDDKLCEKIHGMTGSELAKHLFEYGVSFIASIDSLDEADYEKIVGRKDSFKNLNIALERMQEAGFFEPCKVVDDKVYTRVCISAVVMRNNYDSLEEMRDFWHSKNCQFVCKLPSIMGNVLKNEEEFYTPDEAETVRGKVEECRDKSQTLSLIVDGNKYCLMNQLGIAIDSRGVPLTCLSGKYAFEDEPDYNVKNVKLSEIVIRKKNKFSMEAGACPKKVKFYKEIAKV